MKLVFLARRFFAFNFDCLICVFFVLFLDFVNAFLGLFDSELISLFGIIFFLFYFVILESIYGSTIGKSLFKIEICKNQEYISAYSSLVRFYFTFLIPSSIGLLLSIVMEYSGVDNDDFNFFVGTLSLSFFISCITLCIINGGVLIGDLASKSIVSFQGYTPTSSWGLNKYVMYLMALTILVSMIMNAVFRPFYIEDNDTKTTRNSFIFKRLNEYDINMMDFSETIYNSESFLDFDWSNKNLFVEIGPCGWFSKFAFSERPYNFPTDLSEAIKQHECVHFNIPVKFSALMTSDYEQALIESFKKNFIKEDDYVVLNMSKTWKGEFFYLNLGKKLFFTKKLIGQISLENEIEFMFGLNLQNRNMYFTEFQTITLNKQ